MIHHAEAIGLDFTVLPAVEGVGQPEPALARFAGGLALPESFYLHVGELPESVVGEVLDTLTTEAAKTDFPLLEVGFIRPEDTYNRLRITNPNGSDQPLVPPEDGEVVPLADFAVSINPHLNPDVYLGRRWVPTSQPNVPHNPEVPGVLHRDSPFVQALEQEHGWQWGGHASLYGEGNITRNHYFRPPLAWLTDRQAAVTT